jgi:hypothetical protein
MADIFESPKGMLSRAKRQIPALYEQIKSFVRDKPWSLVRELDVDGATELHKIRFTKSLSEDIPHIIFETANNLRAALDQAATQIGIRHSGKARPSAKFPFGLTEDQVRRELLGDKCKDLPPEIKAVFSASKPYKGGNDLLWALNQIRNIPNNSILVPVKLEGGIIKVSGGVFRGISRATWEWNSERNEIVWLRTDGGTSTYNLDFDVGIAFDKDIDILDQRPPVAILNAMVRAVEKVLMDTEMEARRIGLCD